MNTKGVRIQIVLYERLIAEAVVETIAEVNRLWSRYSVAKYRKGLPLGAAVIQNTQLPRTFNVGVGERVK